jgi:hypothetical protein
MEFPNMPAIYPPFAEWVFAVSYGIFGEDPIGIKVFLLIAECLSVFLFIKILRELQKPLAMIAFYFLCPLPIMQFMIDAHMDAFAFPFVLLFFLLWLKRKTFSASVSLGFAIITKLLPVIFIPFFIKGEKNSRKLAILSVTTAVILVGYIPYVLWNGSPWESLGRYSARWYFNGPVFDVILPITGSNEMAHVIVAGLFIIWFLFIYSRQLPLLENLYFMLFGFFLLSATVHPWYVTWIALMLPLISRWSGVAYVTLINIANIVVINYKAFKIWHLSPGIEILEYTCIFILFFLEVRNSVITRKINFAQST